MGSGERERWWVGGSQRERLREMVGRWEPQRETEREGG